MPVFGEVSTALCGDADGMSAGEPIERRCSERVEGQGAGHSHQRCGSVGKVTPAKEYPCDIQCERRGLKRSGASGIDSGDQKRA